MPRVRGLTTDRPRRLSVRIEKLPQGRVLYRDSFPDSVNAHARVTHLVAKPLYACEKLLPFLAIWRISGKPGGQPRDSIPLYPDQRCAVLLA